MAGRRRARSRHPPSESWIGRVSDAGQQGLGLTAMVLAIAVGGLGGLVIAIQPAGQHGIYRWSGYAVGLAMVTGAALRDRAGRLARPNRLRATPVGLGA